MLCDWNKHKSSKMRIPSFCCMLIYMFMQHHNDTMNNRRVQWQRRRKTSLTIFTSHFICKVRKGCSMFVCKRELETKHKWNILTPKLWPSALCLSRSLGLHNRTPGVDSAGCWLSLLHLISIFSGPQFIRAPSPFGLMWLYLPRLVSNWLQLNPTVLLLFNSSALYYLQTPTRWYGHASKPPQFLLISGDRDMSLPLSLHWPMWSSSSGNNCHPVQRSLSSGASVYESIMGFFFYLIPFHQPISAHAISSHNCH